MIRRVRTREESFLPLHTISGNDIVLVGVGLIVRPPKICDRLLEACKTEYKTRHLIDGRIVQCEQAISIVAGYMTDEVTGLSPFAFMHKDEVRWVMVALRQSKFPFDGSPEVFLISSPSFLQCTTTTSPLASPATA